MPLYAEVENAEARLPELFRLIDGLIQDASSIGVHADPLQFREGRTEKGKQRGQIGKRSCKCVAVRQKDPSRIRTRGQAGRDVPLHLSKAANAEAFLLVSRAENALVMGAADRILEDQAVGLAWRPYDNAFVFGHDNGRKTDQNYSKARRYARKNHEPEVPLHGMAPAWILRRLENNDVAIFTITK